MSARCRHEAMLEKMICWLGRQTSDRRAEMPLGSGLSGFASLTAARSSSVPPSTKFGNSSQMSFFVRCSVQGSGTCTGLALGSILIQSMTCCSSLVITASCT